MSVRENVGGGRSSSVVCLDARLTLPEKLVLDRHIRGARGLGRLKRFRGVGRLCDHLGTVRCARRSSLQQPFSTKVDYCHNRTKLLADLLLNARNPILPKEIQEAYGQIAVPRLASVFG